MSAESHQKRAASTSSDGARPMPNLVPPQPVSDRSIIDSVAGFINDVALTNNPQSDPKDHILWVKFESLADISDASLGEDWEIEGNVAPPLLLCIGYGSGVQVWAIPANGEAIEVMSWKHGTVKVLRVLPTPFLSNNSELASDLLDQFIHKRPLMALCGEGGPIANQPPQPNQQQLHAVNFVSLKDGDVVKSIRFKTPIVDIVANRTSIAITFHERIAVFDARTLEDRLTVTTCYPCPGGLCPIALGDRWLAYAEKKMIPSKSSAGGCFLEGVPSYTATVLNAAKSLGKGLRELGEQVAAGLTGNANINSQSGSVPNAAGSNINSDGSQPGIVTILDIKHPIKDISPTSGTPVAINGSDPIVAHFMAHGEAITAMSFDPSGMLLITADRRGHDFNVFRINPHPSGSALAAVHHLFVLHRGDTSAKVQDIAFSYDSRWVAVSTLRGTTHVFPINAYGGQPGYRTHSAPHVVNRQSRFHRSAGLTVEGRSSSPILMAEHSSNSTCSINPRLPPFPHPTVVLPLAQLRQPSSLSAASSLTSLASSPPQGSKNHMHGRQRLLSEESHSKPLRVAAVFSKARAWLLEPHGMSHENPSRLSRRAVDSLFIIAGHGALIQYDLEPRPAAGIPREKVCDESQIELDVEAKAQWLLGSRTNSSVELSPPLSAENWLIKDRVIDNNLNLDNSQSQIENMRANESEERWLSQVEIVTHAGPHRRLWMGPQFVFRIFNAPSGSSLAHIDTESVEVGASKSPRSNPMNIHQIHASATTTITKPLVPILIESGSASSYEQSPRLLDSFHYESTDSDYMVGPESQLREDLADAMRDCAIVPTGSRDSDLDEDKKPTIKLTTEGSHAPSIDKAAFSSLVSHSHSQSVFVSIVNPQGTVTTVSNNPEDQLVDSFSDECHIHENCDETMFRPVVTVFSDVHQQADVEAMVKPVDVPAELVVPVIDEKMLEKKKREREAEKKEKVRKEAEKVRIAEEDAKKAKEAEKLRKKKEAEAEKARLASEEAERVRKVKEEADKARKVKDEAEKARKAKEEAERAKKLKEEAEKVKKDKEEAEKAIALKEEAERAKKLKEEAEAKKKEKAQKKAEEKNKKALKQNKKPCEPEKKIPEPVAEIEVDVTKFDSVETQEPDFTREKSVEPVKIEIDAIPEPVAEEIIHETALVFEETEPSQIEEVEPSQIEEVEPNPSITFDLPLETFEPVESEIIEVEPKIQPEPESPVISDFPALAPPAPEPTKIDQPSKKVKKSKKNREKASPKEDFPVLSPLEVPSSPVSVPKPIILSEIEDHRMVDQEAIMKISKHETIGDDDIEIVPHKSEMEIKESPNKAQNFVKNEDFYDMDDDLPPLEPLESFDGNFEPMQFDTASSLKTDSAVDVEQKREMKQKMSELLKDTNMIFAMCSSLKEIQEDDEQSMGSSQIQRSTSSSLTTNTTTATFASASSNQTGEGMDSDYKSLDLDLDDASPADVEFKVPGVKRLDEPEDASSFEATSSETDDSSSKRSNAPTFKRDDDEELRPLLQTSVTSLSSPSTSTTTTTTTTEANDPSTLPESNQKPPSQSASGSGKNKKKKRRK